MRVILTEDWTVSDQGHVISLFPKMVGYHNKPYFGKC